MSASLFPTLVELDNVSLNYPFRTEAPSSLSHALTRLRNLARKSKPQLTALKDIHLKIQRGDRIGVIGANGSGKTSLLRMVAGILSPSHGQLTVRGRVLPLIDINSGFIPELTGRENLVLMGLLLGEKRQSIMLRLDELIALAGLEDFADTPTRDYSTGMKARLGFSLVSSLHSEVLVLDEILSTTDAGFLRIAQQRLNQMIDRSGCVLMVAHDLNLIRETCNRVIWLHQGIIQMQGSPLEITREYSQWAQQNPSPSTTGATRVKHWQAST